MITYNKGAKFSNLPSMHTNTSNVHNEIIILFLKTLRDTTTLVICGGCGPANGCVYQKCPSRKCINASGFSEGYNMIGLNL